MKHFLFIATCISALFFFGNPAQAQEKLSMFEHLTQTELPAMTLSLDMTELMGNKKTNNYQAATLKTADGHAFKAEARPRGKYRRINGEIPPVKLKFSKKEMKAMGLDTLNEVRLTFPMTDSPESEALVVKEYLAYRMFESLSPYHVRARLVRLTVVDLHVEKTYRTMLCLLTEHQEEVEARLGGKMEEIYSLDPKLLNQEYAGLHAMFQYLIGNTDWDMSAFRNVYLFRPADGSALIPVPYDFDFSGLVSAPYAVPNSESKLVSVRDRWLMSEGIARTSLQNATRRINDAKANLMAICNVDAQTGMPVAESTQRYLSTFFKHSEEKTNMPERMKVTLK